MLTFIRDLPRLKGRAKKAIYLCSYCNREAECYVGNVNAGKADSCGCKPTSKKGKKYTKSEKVKFYGNKETPWESIPDSGIQRDIQYVPSFSHVSQGSFIRVPSYPLWILKSGEREIGRVPMTTTERLKFKRENQ